MILSKLIRYLNAKLKEKILIQRRRIWTKKIQIRTEEERRQFLPCPKTYDMFLIAYFLLFLCWRMKINSNVFFYFKSIKSSNIQKNESIKIVHMKLTHSIVSFWSKMKILQKKGNAINLMILVLHFEFYFTHILIKVRRFIDIKKKNRYIFI